MKNKILIIDDDYAVLEILNEWLSEDGFQVIAYPETDNILSLIKKFNPQLILLDYLLKGINGGDLCTQIKSIPAYRKLPVVIFSACPQYSMPLDLIGCDLFVQKPFDLYSLTRQINELILLNKVNYANHFA
jgi:two-component system response regulator VicR